MRFLFKIFALGFIGFAVLPAFAPEEFRAASSGNVGDSAAPTALELASFVGQATADVRGICDRQPGVCETGQDLIAYTGTRAREGLVIAYAMFRHGHPSMRKDPAETATVETTVE
ncbi:MAG: DUF5330 domain-containing protein [Oricola sp.]